MDGDLRRVRDNVAYLHLRCSHEKHAQVTTRFDVILFFLSLNDLVVFSGLTGCSVPVNY